MEATQTNPEQRLGPSSLSAARVLGVDPGLLRTGYAVLDCRRRPVVIVEAGVIRLGPRTALPLRLVELQSAIQEIIARTRPGTLACEELYAHYKHPRTAILMGHARGVILAAAATAGLEIFHVASTHVKKFLTGNGHASKVQVQRAIAGTLRLNQLPEPSDVADALAIALCSAYGRTLERRNRAGSGAQA